MRRFYLRRCEPVQVWAEREAFTLAEGRAEFAGMLGRVDYRTKRGDLLRDAAPVPLVRNREELRGLLDGGLYQLVDEFGEAADAEEVLVNGR